MSLLWMDYENEFKNLVETANRYEQQENPEYFASLSPKIHKIIYRDTKYNVDFLYTAYVLNDEKIMENYAVWLFQLMYSVLPGDKSLSETEDYVKRHLGYIRHAISDIIKDGKQEKLLHLLDVADNAVHHAASVQKPSSATVQAETDKFTGTDSPKKYETEIRQYMDSLFSKNMHQSLSLIRTFTENGIPVANIYVDILAESMRRVGELWHTAKISVDTEHYCTSVTQMAMAQLYPVLFSGARKGKTLLCACPGTELHEMGARMVADIFENDGWDSIFLGAAVPEDYILHSIRENQPDLIALSVSMPPHLITCQELVTNIRDEFPDIKIAVGGTAFRNTEQIWKQWPIDYYTDDARELLTLANQQA